LKTGFIEKLIQRLDRLEPRQVEELVVRLMREKGSLEDVFEALREGVLILDREGVVTFLNRAACGFFGLDREEAVGQKLDTLVRGLEWESLTRPGRPSVSRDLEVFYPENRYLNFYLAPLAEDVGGSEEILGYVMLVRDITETRRETEEAIESEKLNALTLTEATALEIWANGFWYGGPSETAGELPDFDEYVSTLLRQATNEGGTK